MLCINGIPITRCFLGNERKGDGRVLPTKLAERIDVAVSTVTTQLSDLEKGGIRCDSRYTLFNGKAT